MVIHKLMILSTAHVPKHVAERLDKMDENHMVSGGSYCDVGWFMFAHDEDPNGVIDPELMVVLDFVRSKGCAYVLFDRDADVIPDLPTWEW